MAVVFQNACDKHILLPHGHSFPEKGSPVIAIFCPVQKRDSHNSDWPILMSNWTNRFKGRFAADIVSVDVDEASPTRSSEIGLCPHHDSCRKSTISLSRSSATILAISGDQQSWIAFIGSVVISESDTMQSPQNIRVHKEQRQLELVWTDSDISRLPFRTVRQNCRCAVCVDEFTGKQLLDPESVPPDLGLLEVSLCGNYALRIRWSDNHDSGLFTWNHLRSIADAAAAS